MKYILLLSLLFSPVFSAADINWSDVEIGNKVIFNTNMVLRKHQLFLNLETKSVEAGATGTIVATKRFLSPRLSRGTINVHRVLDIELDDCESDCIYYVETAGGLESPAPLFTDLSILE